MPPPGQRGLLKKAIYSGQDYADLVNQEAQIKVDSPAPNVSRIWLSNPSNKNRMGNVMRAQLLSQLYLNDQDPDTRVTIVCGEGENFCSGQDVAGSRGVLPFFTNESDGQTARNIVEGWFAIMDLAKPVIAMIHGDCLGSGMELAAACDVVVCADDVRIGYPEGRNMGLGDFQIYPWMCGMRSALSIMLLAETMDGPLSVHRGFSTKSVPFEELEGATLGMANRISKIPADLLAFNKRSVHRAFEAQGMRANIRHGVDLEALMMHTSSGNILTRAAMQGGARRRPGPSGSAASAPGRKRAVAGSAALKSGNSSAVTAAPVAAKKNQSKL